MAELRVRSRAQDQDEEAPLAAHETLHVCGGCGAGQLGEFPKCAHGLAPHAAQPHPDAPEPRYPLAHWVAHNLTHHTEVNRAHAAAHRHHLPEDHPEFRPAPAQRPAGR